MSKNSIKRRQRSSADWRRRDHISDCKNVFIPLSRMRQIKHEEDVVRSIANREDEDPTIQHFTCHCGSVGCLCTPINMK